MDNDALLQTAAPIVDFLLGLVLGVAVLGLNLPFQLLAIAVDLAQLIISKLSPLLLRFTGELLPVSLNAVPIHCISPVAVKSTLLNTVEPSRFLSSERGPAHALSCRI